MNTMTYIEYLTDSFDPSEYDENDTTLCPECGEEIDEIDLNHFGMHEECYLNSEKFAKSLTMENAMNCENDTVEIPNFLTFVFDEEQIRDILLEKFSQLSENERERNIKDYALDDIQEWAERTNNG